MIKGFKNEDFMIELKQDIVEVCDPYANTVAALPME